MTTTLRIENILLRGCKRYVFDSIMHGVVFTNKLQMQAAGSPPPDLVGDMNAAQEALSDIDQGCPTQ